MVKTESAPPACGQEWQRRPVVDAGELAALDQAEVLEGYRDGLAGDRCGDNRSRSYWHGWRNGISDKAGTADADQHALARSLRALPRTGGQHG